MADKSFIIYPEKTHHFWWFFAGILLIPLLGAGIYIIYKKLRELSSITYKITDQQITGIDHNITDTIELADIHSIDIYKRWIDKKFNIGTLYINTDSRSLKMLGIKNPDNLSSMIMTAAEAERLRLAEISKINKPQPVVPPGNLDRLDYLTGLWQQGLISDDDFKKERKHFEN
ncbi:MAG: PH domain-containing protein [Balneolaceae bacterium]|nr:MAG: PH domain-containing protein [Balneolaceae bacterium]